jgi:hypothetical protein
MIEGQYIRDSVVKIFGLVEHCLSMEGSKVLVEVDSEEVERPLSRFARSDIMAEGIVVMVGCFGAESANLLVAAGIPRYEQDRYTFYLKQS